MEYGDFLGDLLMNDGVTPEQFAHIWGSTEPEPEQRLWMALFVDAIYCANLEPVNNHCRLLRAEAREWIETDLERPPFLSCRTVCDLLNLNIEKLRAWLHRKHPVVPRTHRVTGSHKRMSADRGRMSADRRAER